MSIRIGTIFTGTVEKLGEESIQTKFFMVGVPLIPLQSFFVLKDRGNGVDGFAIALHGKSVGLAYARWAAGVGAVIAGIMAMVTPSYRRGPGDFFIAGLFTAAWIFLTFFTVKARKATWARRAVFKATTGVSATPDLLPAHVAQEIHDSLMKSPRPDDDAWRFVSSSYEAALQGDAAARRDAEEAWGRLLGVDAAHESANRLIDDNQNR